MFMIERRRAGISHSFDVAYMQFDVKKAATRSQSFAAARSPSFSEEKRMEEYCQKCKDDCCCVFFLEKRNFMIF